MNKHDTLLLACEKMENRQYVRNILGNRYHLLEASNVQQTLLLFQQNRDCIAAVVLDVSQSDLINIDLLGKPEWKREIQQVPVIVLLREDTPHMLHRGFELGAADVIPLNYEPFAMLRRIETIVDLHLHRQYLAQMVQEQADALWQTNETLVDALAAIIEYRSTESGQHIIRIRRFVKILLEEVARCCPEYGLTERMIGIISSASVLHDIGKIAIPDRILMKEDRLTPDEWKIMKTHSAVGCQILETIRGVVDKEYLRYGYNICRYHHERWDGRGYPEGLYGDQIPICAQVVGLADAYDALTNERKYKKAYSCTRAVNMILRGECGAFSPKLLECFKHVTREFERLTYSYADGRDPRMDKDETILPPPQETNENSIDRVQEKYMALTHFINSMLVEVNLNQNLFHVVYNPYPDMGWMREINSFSDLVQLLDEGNTQPERSFKAQLTEFIAQDFRRATCYIAPNGKQKNRFEATLLRMDHMETDRQSLAILFRRMEKNKQEKLPQEADLLMNSNFLCRYDEHFTLLRFNENIPLLAGYSRQEIHDCLNDQLEKLLVEEDVERVRAAFKAQFDVGNYAKVEYRIRRKDGSVIWVMDTSVLSVGDDGVEYMNSLLTDISESKVEYENLKNKLHRYEIILAQTENVLFDWDVKEDRIEVSETWSKIFKSHAGFQSVREILSSGAYFHPDDLPLFIDKLALMEEKSDYEVVDGRIAVPGGDYIWCRFRCTGIRDAEGKLEKICGVILNIDAEKRAEENLQSLAQRDGLTKLLNKKAARKRAEEYLAQFPEGTPCAMLMIDLDNFKQINDRFGHLFGDTVLVQVSREISRMFRDQDIVARIGGDEFMVFMRGINERSIVENRCLRLLNVLSGLFKNEMKDIALGCSIGVALSPEHGVTYFDLFNKADHALYQIKKTGKHNFAFYDNHSAQSANDKIGISAVNNPIDSDNEPESTQENLVNTVLHRLYDSDDVEKGIQEILAMVGKKTNVSRVYVFENSDDNQYCTNTYEWCNDGIEPEKHMLQKISYVTDIPGYEENFDERGIFYCSDITVLPPQTFEIVKAQNIQSMLQCAIRENGVFRGYIGFDECVERRLWTKEHIQLLSDFSEMLSVFLLKHREHEKTIAVSRKLNDLLDNQRDES